MKFVKDLIWALPVWIDRWRLVPRAMIIVYLGLVIEVSFWFMGLPMPSPAQSAFATGVLGIGTGWFAIYAREPAKETQIKPHNNSEPKG